MNHNIVTIADHEQAANHCMSEAAWAYFSGGAADEITLRQNISAWQSWGLAPRVLRNLQGGHTRVHLLGQEYAVPVLVAPMAYQRWAHHHGESGMAMAAAAQGCGMVVSHQTSTPLQDVAESFLEDHDHGPLWFQMYWQPDRGHTQALLSDIEDAGYQAIVLTVDAPVHGVRDRERRHGMPLPNDVHAAHWPARSAANGVGLCGGLADLAPTWDDVQWLASQTRLPVLLKGITHPQDARLAMQVGGQGIVVSNHGGRVLDTVPATAELLPSVVSAVRAEHPNASILVDGGIRRGSDVFKALALGADAVMVGRPVLFGLAHAGARGAAHVLRLLRDELETTMTLCGCRTLQDIHSDHLAACHTK